MLVGTLTELQRGSLWGVFAEAFLVGLYSCLLIVTLWAPITTGRPLTVIGWIIIAIYCLTICRFVLEVCALFRTLLVNGGEVVGLESVDYVIQAMKQAFTFVAATLADSLFCWRLYMIWSQNTRIILFPAVLLIIHTIICIVIVVIGLLLTPQPRHTQYLTSLLPPLNVGELCTIFLYTFYTTALIAGRLWWVGREVNKFTSPEEAKKNRYVGAIAALVQSGVIYLTMVILLLIAVLTMNDTMMVVLNPISAIINGISSTLLVLQLNMFQEYTVQRNMDGPPLTTGASIKFAKPGTSSEIPGEWAPTHSPVATGRQASRPTTASRQ
ncbi:hypothetical protein FRB94_014154 [Tulasnella sp. JGI-2019a]|nr:hypothetical protein FRB93_008421 [Tulasnella sp. JGI-2019a]KAG9007636.1 hypothetical protein FRB94_014154 [Tulasnella sp. JGI-2019a]KAG9033095.1 hypothetical protein FRB95_000599 [Tulasnella sp. JGI-2019a]